MKIVNTIQKQSPAILAGLGVAGFITSVIMSAKATPKAMDILEEMPENSTAKEKAEALVPVYAPTAAMVLISTACIVGSNRIHNYRYASLLALYSIGQKSLARWQDAVLDEVGRKKYEDVRERVLKPDGPVPESILIDDERVLFYDVYSGRYFRSDSVETVRKVVNDLNDILYRDDWVSLNEFYYEIGLPPTEFGGNVGWLVEDGSIKIDLDAYLKDDRPCVSVSFQLKPKEY